MQNIDFQIIKATDRQIIDQVSKALKKASLDPLHLTLNLQSGGALSTQFAQCSQNTEIQEILSLNNELTRSITIQVPFEGKHFDIVLTRNGDGPDKVTISLQNIEDKHRVRILRMQAALREDLVAVDGTTFRGNQLGDSLKQHYEAREHELNRLQTIAQSLIIDQEKYRQQLEQDTEARKAQLEAEHQKRLEKLQTSEAAVDKRLKEIDDRESKHVRRQLLMGMKDELKKYSESFTLTEGTKRLRWPIHRLTIALLLFESAGFLYTFGLSLGLFKAGSDLNQTVLYIKQATFALALASTAYFYIKWQNLWFERHAHEEFQLKRLGMDLDRASWAVEWASEWIEEKKKDIPPALLNRLTDHLFERDTEENESAQLHPIDLLLGASAEANMKLPGGTELKLDRKGLRTLQSTTELTE